MAIMTIYILPTQTRGCAPQSPETDENDENGGCPSGKTRVFQKQGFRHPDMKNAQFSTYLGDYSYSFQETIPLKYSQELSAITTVT